MISRIDFYSNERSERQEKKDEESLMKKPDASSELSEQEEMSVAARKFHQTIYEKAK
jgi:hypothetical protein